MTDDEELSRTPKLERAVEALRTLEPLSGRDRDAARARLQRRLEEEARAPRRGIPWWRSLAEPRVVRVAPLAAAGALLAVLLAGAVVGRLTTAPGGGADLAPSEDTSPSALASTVGAELVRFVCVAPNAERVSLVGDFNRWSAGATPMRAERDGVWTVELRVPAGRHLYAFLVDGRDWRADVAAPLAGDDSFGKPTSVVLVGN